MPVIPTEVEMAEKQGCYDIIYWLLMLCYVILRARTIK